MSTVVLCGALGASTATWERQRPALAGHDVVLVDHPGHGGAPVVEIRGVRDLAGRVLERAGAERFSFVGLSLGGAIGMRLALDAPERLERLVLCCTAARFGEPEQWRERAALVRSDGLAPLVDATLERWFTPAFPGRERFRAAFLATDPEGYARCCEALAAWDVRSQLAGIGVPTLCVAGAGDPTAPPAELDRIAAAVPGARLAVLEEARHLAPVERADAFNPLLAEFLG